MNSIKGFFFLLITLVILQNACLFTSQLTTLPKTVTPKPGESAIIEYSLSPQTSTDKLTGVQQSTEKQPSLARSPNPPKPPGQGGQGPFFHQIYSASSHDGLTWTHDDSLLLDHASVPSAIVTPDGKIRIYYVDASQMPETTNCAESSDGGKTFQVLNCKIDGMTTEKALDPSIILLSDGRYRLYYYGGSSGNPNSLENHSIYSAISNDGIHFAYEGITFEYPGLVDPDVFWVGNDWLMYVFSIKDRSTIIARSRDGLIFDYVNPLNLKNWGTVAPVKLDDGRYRLYAFDQRSSRSVGSFLSSDGINWTKENGERLKPQKPDQRITDPFVVRLPDKSWKMFFKIQGDNQSPGEGPQEQGYKPGERPCLPEKKVIAIPDPGGPSYHQVLIARSTDGLKWQANNQVIIDQASVPEGLRLPDGRLIIYAVDGSGQGGSGLVYAESKDEGNTWVCGKIDIQGADPDVVVLPDGRIRLYHVVFPFNQGPGQNQEQSQGPGQSPGQGQGPSNPPGKNDKPNQVKSAISSDGKIFTPEEGVRIEGKQYTDPDVIQIGGEWFMYISTGATAWAARSPDGLDFELIGRVNESGAVSGSYIFPDGAIRHYFCGMNGIQSGLSEDGQSRWKPEAGIRINRSPGQQTICDPSLLSDGKNGYLMVYKIQPKTK